jgi:hypothetical protein
MAFGRQRLNTRLETLAQFVGQDLAVDNLSCHRRFLQK